MKDEPNTRNASGKSVSIVLKIDLMIYIGTGTKVVNFYVDEKLATSVILGFDICDGNVELIKPNLTYRN